MSLLKTAQFCVNLPHLLVAPCFCRSPFRQNFNYPKTSSAPLLFAKQSLPMGPDLWARKWMQLGPFPAALAVQILFISPNLFTVLMSQVFHFMRWDHVLPRSHDPTYALNLITCFPSPVARIWYVVVHKLHTELSIRWRDGLRVVSSMIMKFPSTPRHWPRSGLIHF